MINCPRWKQPQKHTIQNLRDSKLLDPEAEYGSLCHVHILSIGRLGKTTRLTVVHHVHR